MTYDFTLFADLGLEVEHDPANEISALLVVRDFRRVATEKWIAIRGQRRVRICRHVARVATQRDVLGEGVLQSAADAVCKIGTGWIAAAVRFVRKPQTACGVGPPFVIRSQKHIQDSKLILVHVRVERFYIRSA